MGRHRLASLLAALGAAVVSTTALAQPSALRGPAPGAPAKAPNVTRAAPVDSIAAIKAARNAQTSFERIRRRYLPLGQGGSGGHCDETIGRYCYWDDDDTSEYTVPAPIPAEAARVVEARLELLATLDSAGARLPGDDWIAGQHVRYLIEAGRVDQAVVRAMRCGATPWWCSALLGLADHAGWQYAASDSAFAAALAAMPEAERCRWTDLSDLLADSVRSRYARATCEERAATNDRLWWLADPLHLRPGNDRRTEHYARMTMDRIQRRAASGYGTTWHDDLGELLLRYGWPSHFAQTVPPLGHTESPGVLAYDRSPSYHFLADGDPLDSVADLEPGRWTLRPLGPRERYAPPYATFATLRQVTSVFRRGDSLLVVAAYDADGDTLMPAGPLTGALILSPSPSGAPVQAVQHDAGRRGTLTAMTPDTAMLASVEIVGGNRVQRARLGVGLADSPGSRIRISDLALFDAGDSLPRSFDDFVRVASASTTARRGSKVGLYWELYGLRPTDEELSLRIQVVREGRSWLRRAGERIGLVGRQGTLGFGWRESNPGETSVAPRSIVVDLTGLDPGVYRIELRLSGPDAQPVTASRRLEIIR